MVSLKDCITTVDMLSVTYTETANALRLDAAKYVDKADYENAQRAIYLAEFCETCCDAVAKLRSDIAEIG